MPEIRLSFVPYDKCKHDLISFRNSNRETNRDELYFDWRYLGRKTEIKPVVVWAEDAKGEKVGSMSIVPHRYLADNSACLLGILGDISVDERCRGRGIAKQMLNFLPEIREIKKFSGCLVLPNVEAARPLEKTGWTTVSRLERYVKFLDVEQRLKSKLGSKAVRASFSFPLNYMLSVLSFESLPIRTLGYKAELADGFDSRFDALWKGLQKHDMVIGFRDSEYLNWRYARHPLVKYKIYTLVKNSILRGYIVFHYEGTTCYIDDFMSTDEKHCQVRLMSYFLRFIKGVKSLSSVVLQSNKNDLSLVAPLRFGFFKRRDYQKLMLNFNDASLSANGSKWYLTAGDKDV